MIKNYNVEKAINFVLEPGSVSELSEFSKDSDSEDEMEQLSTTRNNDDQAFDPISYKKRIKEVKRIKFLR